MHHKAKRLQTLYHSHTDFILLLILFVTFRVLALAVFRPGGLVLDFSDFYWYRAFAELTRQGYYPYDNLWTTYPPLFPFVMIAIYQLSTLLPPWNFPNLWFTLLLGGFFLLFEIGNFILLYLFTLKLSPAKSADQPVNEQKTKNEKRGTTPQSPTPLLLDLCHPVHPRLHPHRLVRELPPLLLPAQSLPAPAKTALPQRLLHRHRLPDQAHPPDPDAGGRSTIINE